MKKVWCTLLMVIAGMAATAQYDTGIRIEPLLKGDTTVNGGGFHYPGVENDEVTILKITFKPGQSTGWHKHDFPVFAYVLKGELTAEWENGKTIRYKKDDALAEMINAYHNGKNTGKRIWSWWSFILEKKAEAFQWPKGFHQRWSINAQSAS